MTARMARWSVHGDITIHLSLTALPYRCRYAENTRTGSQFTPIADTVVDDQVVTRNVRTHPQQSRRYINADVAPGRLLTQAEKMKRAGRTLAVASARCEKSASSLSSDIANEIMQFRDTC